MPTLSELAGAQARAVAVLSAAVQGARLHHAYLLVASEPAAALELAKALAASLVCPERRGADACGACSACRKYAGGNHPDVTTLAPNEKGLIGVDAVRAATARLSLKAAESDIKVVLVDSIDSANAQAQNALLKTLEEPPGRSCFVLTARRLRALLPTVRSRCATLRLAPADRMRAHERLAAQGMSPDVARLLGPVAGGDLGLATELSELGALDIDAALVRALSPQAGAVDLVAVAADLGQSRERADLALALLEVKLRDLLAARHGASGEQLFGEVPKTGAKSPRVLAAAVERLWELRRLVAIHVNRTLALEGVLMGLAHGDRA